MRCTQSTRRAGKGKLTDRTGLSATEPYSAGRTSCPGGLTDLSGSEIGTHRVVGEVFPPQVRRQFSGPLRRMDRNPLQNIHQPGAWIDPVHPAGEQRHPFPIGIRGRIYREVVLVAGVAAPVRNPASIHDRGAGFCGRIEVCF